MSGGSGEPGLGGREANAQRPDGAALAYGAGQLVEPFAVVHYQTLGQAGAKALGQGPGLVVAGGTVGGRDHRAEVPQLNLGDPGERGVGPVMPFGRLQDGSELFRQRQNRLRLDLGETLLSRLGVHALNGPARAGHAAPQYLAGQGSLLLGKGGNRRLPMDPLGLEAGSPRAGRRRGALAVLGAGLSLGSPVIAAASLTARLAPSGPVGAGVAPVAGPPPGPVGAAGLAAGAVWTTALGIAISAPRAAVAPVPRVAVSPTVTLIAGAPPLARGGCTLPLGAPVGAAVAAGSGNERGGHQRAGTAAY